MNKVLPWVKSNWLIVVLSVLILAILPTSLIISSGMNTALREQVQKRVDDDARELGAANLTYTIVSPIPGVPDVEYEDVANKAIIDWFQVQRDAIQSEATQVWTNALAFNRGEHKLLMEGLFPKPPADADERVARNDFTRLMVEQVPQGLLDTLQAGPPPDAVRLSADLLEHAQRRHEQLIAQTGGTALTKEQGEALQSELTRIRLENYRRRAEEISLYADITSFPDLPTAMLTNAPSLEYCWEWQEAVWALNDFAAAVAAANTGIPGRPKGVSGSVVKRLVRVKVNEPPARFSEGDEGGSRRRGSDEGSGLITLNPSVSVTGRVSGIDTDNSLYDVRLIEAEIIISTRHIPVFLNAIAATNFMTVLDMDLERVEPMEDLAKGFVYGEGEHVVKAKMQIETLWFREWVAPSMPEAVRRTRGAEVAAAEGAAGEGTESTPDGG